MSGNDDNLNKEVDAHRPPYLKMQIVPVTIIEYFIFLLKI